MTYSFLALNRGKLALAALAAVAVAVSACSGIGGSVSPVSSNAAVRPATYSNFITIKPDAGGFNLVTGINNASPTEIVGYYYASGSADYAESFTSVAPYATFAPYEFPNANGTELESITSIGPPAEAGWIFGPQANCRTSEWGVVDYAGLWSYIPQYNGQGACRQSYEQNVENLYGINDSHDAVGYYEEQVSTPSSPGPPGPPTAFVVSPGDNEKAINFKMSTWQPPSVAYGINDAGDMVGTVNVGGAISSPNISGWYFIAAGSGCFEPLNVPGAKAGTTVVRSINESKPEQVAGWYEDSSNSVTYGFVYTLPSDECATSGGLWQMGIDAPNSNGTMISGINNTHLICGWYADKSTHLWEGFVASPGTLRKLRQRT